MTVFCDAEECKSNVNGKCKNKFPNGVEAIRVGIASEWYACNAICIDFVPKAQAEKQTNADVRPVVRGSWEKHGDGACSCSVCQLGLESFVEGIFYNYCPFCGADMREAAE